MRRNLPLLLVRIIVGIVFLTEGILKFMLPDELGAGRFTYIGLPAPGLLAHANLYAGEAAALLLCVIITALVTTKLPILIGHSLGRFGAPKSAAHAGVLGFLHEARTDLAMLFSLVAILIDSGVGLVRQREWWQRR
jgi:uncharacterized membrane protein YphA (DoxX/SURF4 family)